MAGPDEFFKRLSGFEGWVVKPSDEDDRFYKPKEGAKANDTEDLRGNPAYSNFWRGIYDQAKKQEAMDVSNQQPADEAFEIAQSYRIWHYERLDKKRSPTEKDELAKEDSDEARTEGQTMQSHLRGISRAVRYKLLPQGSRPPTQTDRNQEGQEMVARSIDFQTRKTTC
ncbi:uncharacterized protein Z519_00043 [Cladophialophora bantiana CBS 173.52]|uniref:Uncharacterized protein n=1 Tax=Cladophialophora bantiana (strain ATCC 10958 / CBS 173.52 / CDC B-1940 / NIH 8579) TaxID=1442370 RepID=A0A0D2HY75_CLAB1|nr:uncharacterized protein Z519_00043 [Cladophialophora bantiana CBS 173.52]KIW98383.1 hypothetical protein Z519_00043 [Cladophialophora bantiana CBS 173.52]